MMNCNFGVNYAFKVIFCSVDHTSIMDFFFMSVMVLLSVNKSI